MFFVLSKVFAFLTVPSNVMLLAAIAGGILLFTRYARAGRVLVALSLVLVAIAGVSPFGSSMMSALEQRFPSWDGSRGAPTGFIVLGGVVDSELSKAYGTTVLGGAAERLTIVAELARRYPGARFIFSGGNASIFGGPAEADHVLHLFESFGVARERVILERRSRSTAENATFSKELASPRPGELWAVVTSANHMPRAIGAFRAAGFEVAAYPVDWQAPRGGANWNELRNFITGLSAVDAAAHEFIGLFAYWLTGQSSELFPAP
jgi:uncharacterized SAM-binding protein YcdF (DUF218 family)